MGGGLLMVSPGTGRIGCGISVMSAPAGAARGNAAKSRALVVRSANRLLVGMVEGLVAP